MVEANQLAMDCIKSLKDANWVADGQMSKENFIRFLEFFCYIFHSLEKARRASLTLNFKPGGNVLDFVLDLEVKLQQHAKFTDVKAS